MEHKEKRISLIPLGKKKLYFDRIKFSYLLFFFSNGHDFFINIPGLMVHTVFKIKEN